VLGSGDTKMITFWMRKQHAGTTSRPKGRLRTTFLGAFAALAASVGLAAPAHAAWESIGACPASGVIGMLLASERQPLRIGAGFDGEIEVFGHLLDTVRDVNLTGITGREISVVRGDSGFENGGRGVVGNTGPRFCALGSLIVRVKIPHNTPRGTRGTLVIGGERIPVEIVVDTFAAAWSGVNDSSSLSPETQPQFEANLRGAAAQSRQACVATAQGANYQRCLANRPAIVQERAARCAAAQNSSCRQGGGSGNCVSIPNAPSPCDPLRSCEALRDSEVAGCATRNQARVPAARTPRCLRDLGGRSLLMADGTLEVTLPSPAQATDQQLSECLRQGFDVDLVVSRAQRNFGPGNDSAGTARARFEVASQTGAGAATVSGDNIYSGDAVIRFPGDLRQRLSRNGINFGTAGTITVRNRSLPTVVGLGDSTTVLRYAIVPPPTELVAPPVTRPIPRRPF